ncbi:MAG: DUF362 domain-containing protein [Thermodesulfobacteria bacterium]|nr:DUF362 domain-containing protein [Thermodesulfobacteriota bacterium]
MDRAPIHVFISKVDKNKYLSLTPESLLDKDGKWFVELFYKHISSLLSRDIRGENVLVKPNLLKAKAPECVTSGLAIVAAVISLREVGARVTVGDSPAFGHARQVVGSLGIGPILKRLGVETISLDSPVKVSLPCGAKIAVSKHALDRDVIVNLPRLKAHCQTGMTGAVKNLYGTVPGFRKGLYHVKYGKELSLFSRMIIEIGQLLPETISVLDAINCMHETGPTVGKPIFLGVVASSTSTHALDTAMYHAIGAEPDMVPIWKEARKLGLKGTSINELTFPWLEPKDITEAKKFKIPRKLDPVAFNPVRFLLGRVKSVARRIGIMS